MGVIDSQPINSEFYMVDGEKEFHVSYHVRTDSRFTGPLEIKNSIVQALPGQFYQYGDDSDQKALLDQNNMSIVRMRTGQDDSHQHWEVRLVYTTQATFRNACDWSNVDPWDRPARWGGNFQPSYEEMTGTYNGGKVLNSAGQPYPRMPQRELRRHSFWVSRSYNPTILNKDTFPQFEALAGSLNDANLWHYPIKTLRLFDMQWTQEDYNSSADGRGCIQVPNCRFYMLYDPGEHQEELLDEGYMEKVSATETAYKTDRNGLPVISVQKLNGNGLVLDPDSDPVVTYYDKYEPKDWSILGLPTDFMSPANAS